MYRPTTRVLAVLELLQTHGRMSGAELSRRIEVDGRTLRRYIVMLEEIGIPITAERGRYGGYALMPGFKLPPMMFTDDEALALSLGLLAARSLGLAEAAPAVASAQAKLERIMPDGLKRRVGAIDATVSLDLASGTAPPDNGALAALSAAAQVRQRVRLRYRSPGAEGETERLFDPYGLAYYLGFWYAVGHCHLRGAMRTFRLDRIVEVQPVLQAFERPEDFDAMDHLRLAIATLPRKFAATVLLHCSLAEAQERLPGYMGLFEQTPQGVLLHNQSDELEWFARQLASLPFGFTVQSPPELNAVLRRHAHSLLQSLPVG
ncbi:helix-turn-helix transcriptional regulator [Massilia endophytica]|uniref:helix-turn-helix transcriptional regulator n=1 Tax=Massilia endophytica TaxID=2899220 RepID=UPI001E482BDE|nr:YafY family protein [Massilia endophytica]UGQ48644.1 YafY family transcriptional regulator [Massilia endophytica]